MSPVSTGLRAAVTTERYRNPHDPLPMERAYRMATAARRRAVLPTPLQFLHDLDTYATSQLTHTVGTVEIRVRVWVDGDAWPGTDDVSGTFTDERSEHTIRNAARYRGTDYAWYEPSTYRQQQTLDTYRARGMSAASARLARQADIFNDMIFDSEITYVGVEVAVRVGGQTVGSGSVWAIATHPSEGYAHLAEVAMALISEAAKEASDDRLVKQAAQHVLDLVEAKGTLANLGAL